LEIAILNHKTHGVVVKGDQYYGGSALGKDLTQVKEIHATLGAFAALKFNGNVELWGNGALGGTHPLMPELHKTGKVKMNIKKLISNEFGFAAILADYSVLTWGHQSLKLPKHAITKEKVKDIVATSKAFAAHTEYDSAYSWGPFDFGGDKNDDELRYIECIVGSVGAFAIKIKHGHFVRRSNEKGDIIIWGDGDSVSEAEENLKQLCGQ